MPNTHPRIVAQWRDRLIAHVTVGRFYLFSIGVFLLALALLLGHSAYSGYVLTICVLFTVIFFGLVGLNLGLLRRTHEEVPPFDVDEPSGGLFRTFTGTIRKGEAKLQVMIIPAAVILGFLALAVVNLWDQAHML